MDEAWDIDEAVTVAWEARGEENEDERGTRGTWRQGKATRESRPSEEYVENP